MEDIERDQGAPKTKNNLIGEHGNFYLITSNDQS